MAEKVVDTRPVIRGVIKKEKANPLAKNQVDKIMNEFNRVKINYYSKENYVEFTNIDYFYCDSDLESVRSEKVGKLGRNVLEKFEAPEAIDDRLVGDVVVVPKNSVKDKIDLFSKLDVIFQPLGEGELKKAVTAPVIMQQPKKSQQNLSAANKNQNKCFIKDVNVSLRDQLKSDDGKVLDRITAISTPASRQLLLNLEQIVNNFDMSLLRTIDGLITDDAFAGIKRLKVSTRPSLQKFIETFDSGKIDAAMENVELSAIEANKIQLQMRVNATDVTTGDEKCANINVIFMAQYETDDATEPAVDGKINDFFIYFTSFYEVLKGLEG
jgi:hypothetical protein